MKKSEIKIGQSYEAKVSDRIVTVRIDSTNSHGGWNATNTATGKRIRIRGPQRLRRAVRPGRRKSAAQPTDETTVSDVAQLESPPVVDVAADEAMSDTNGDGAKTAKPRRERKTAEPKPKRVSALDAAAQVLADAGQPMRAKEMIDAMTERGLWSSPGGKTPEATLYAAVSREIAARGAAARFKKVDRGLFASAAVVEA